MGGLNKSLKEKFEDANNKRIILSLELAALLHDIGKLSSLFLQYRQKWQKNEDGWNWNNDPHCNEFFKKDELLKTNFKNLLDLFQKDLLSGDPGDFIKPDSEGSKPLFSKFTIQDSVHYHEKDPSKPGEVPSEIKDLIKVIKAADSFDAAWDRNNPLFYSDQTEGDIFETNVFGKEYCEDKIDFNSLDEKREKIYETLKEDLSRYLTSLRYCLNSKNEEERRKIEEERRKILETIKENSQQGTLSVTNRPDNDTSLWEHSYAVASLVKVILGHYLIYEELLDQFGKVRFGIFGVGWDGISFISKGQKIGDILGRKRIINELKSEIKKTVEFEFCLGNSIYEDDNGIYFLIPAFLSEKGDIVKCYEKYLDNLKTEIIKKSYEISEGDLMPHFYFEGEVKNTQFITHLTLCIQELRKRIPIPVLFPDHKILKKEKEWPSGKTICPICQRRPIIDETKNICKTCLERRGNNVKDTLKEGYTPFASEIALANPQSKKLCLIIARFELENWLNGRMIRTLFVKNAPLLENEVKNLGKIIDFAYEENKAKAYFNREGVEYNFRRIKKEITNPTNDTIFLYSRRNKFEIPDNLKAQLERLEISALEELQKVENREHILENVICAKTPTPSTILDVWMTTQEFNQGLNGKDFFPEKKRPVLTGINKNVEGIDFYAIYEGKINNISCEVVPIKEKNGEVKILIISHTYDEFIQQIKGENKLVMKKLEGKTIEEIEVPFKEVAYQKYYPLRLITQSPELYLAIVPADSALQFTNQIYKKYIREYGKVIGRLPFAIGNIFFDKHMPMFIVLDAARRLLKTFERNSKKPVSAKIEEVEKDGKVTIKLSYAQKPLKSFSWQLPYRLGNNDIDYHHPFFILSSQANLDYNARKTLFPTVQGNVIHFSELKGCDTIEIYPNFYKFRFLDATTRRYELYEPESEDFALQIYTVEDIEQTFEQLWSFLLTKITDTSLRHIEELLSDKLREWADDSGKLPPEADRIWEELAKVTIISAFGFKPEEIISSEFQFLMRSLKSKAFFDLIELYARILKRRLEEEK
jgi:CRISPR-associated Csx11 family protein